MMILIAMKMKTNLKIEYGMFMLLVSRLCFCFAGRSSSANICCLIQMLNQW
jgi:hypothetical protein